MLIGALVGGLIIFLWQFVSWSFSGLHDSQMQYTPEQEVVLEAMSNLEEGSYFMPALPKSATSEESAEFMKEIEGKPWATVSYHKEYKNNMPMNMIRGFVADFIAVFFLCWILLQFADLNFRKSLLASLAVGLIGFLTYNYINSIWFEGNTIPDLVDVIVNWGLVGVWLGWWLKR